MVFFLFCSELKQSIVRTKGILMARLPVVTWKYITCELPNNYVHVDTY